jgi:hypothetical protein
MTPDEVYVVYSQNTDEILSVHSTKLFALMARQDLVNDVMAQLSRTCAYVDADDEVKVRMKYVVGTLQEALGWMKFDFKTQEIY